MFLLKFLSSFSYFLNESQDHLFVCVNVRLLKFMFTESLWDTGDVAVLFQVYTSSLLADTFLSLIQRICNN